MKTKQITTAIICIAFASGFSLLIWLSWPLFVNPYTVIVLLTFIAYLAIKTGRRYVKDNKEDDSDLFL